jgi:hypothetical protein
MMRRLALMCANSTDSMLQVSNMLPNAVCVLPQALPSVANAA